MISRSVSVDSTNASIRSDSSESSSSSRSALPAIHVPLWTTPGWKDDAAARSGTDLAVRDPILDTLRPMMLDTDRARNPSRHAVRFGIFPGRSDGRSCTSPTRAATRLIGSRAGSCRTLTGRELTNKLEELARRRGLHLDDYLTSRASGTLQQDGQQELEYLKAFDQVLIEEFWQGCLFGDMTMDELLAGNYFEIGDFKSNLSGPIHSLFSRGKWDQSPFGVPDVSTVTYRLDGTSFDMEVEWSDEVWDCLQPTLQMATRLFCQDDPFFKAILNVGNWYEMPSTAGRNRKTATAPNFKIELRNHNKNNKNNKNSEAIGYRHNARPSAAFDPVALTLKVLESKLKWRIVSAHYDIESPVGKFEAETALGTTRYSLCSSSNCISIDLAAEAVWQLLTTQLSCSEKTMVSWMLAATMVHELCHAIIEATLLWIRYPREYGVTDPTDLRFCELLEKDLYLSESQYRELEPYYKNDSVKEIGESFERHVLGHGPYPMAHLSFYKPVFLSHHGVLTSSFDQSEFSAREDAKHDVPAPYAVGERSFTFNSHSTVQTFFTQEFWNTTFKKYGSAALRSAPEIPPRVAWFSAVESSIFHRALDELAFGSPGFREWASSFIAELQDGGQKVIAQYIKALIYDAWQFPMLARRFVELAENWYHRGERLTAQAAKAEMIAYEAGIFFLCKNGRISASDKKEAATAFHAQWGKLRGRRCVEPDDVSASLNGTVDQFISDIVRVEDAYDERIAKSLMDFSKLLHQELRIQEAMVAQLYELPAGFWGHYVDGIPGHQLIWRARINGITVHLMRLLGHLNGLQAHLPCWRSEWQAKVLSWLSSFRNISYLISRDAREVHVNWREMLHTVPMLRKSKRKVWERWYFLAKRAMLNLKGGQLAKLEEFEQRYAKDFDLNTYKIVLPSRSTNAQGLAEKWAGLLDDIVEFERDEARLMEDLGQEEKRLLESVPGNADVAAVMDPRVQGQYRAQQLLQAMETAEANGIRLRAERADWYRQGAHNQLASKTLSWRYQLQEARHDSGTRPTLCGSNEPQITRALVEDYPVPYASSGAKKKRDWDLYTSPLDAFEAPASKKRCAVSPPIIDNLPQLMAEVNKGGRDNTHRPAGRTPQLITRIIQISGDVIEELADSVQQDVDMMDVDSDEAGQRQQAGQVLASEMQDAMRQHKKALNEAVQCQTKAHDVAREERDRTVEMWLDEEA
ncbi:hypothetical protein Trco_000150 [Trichoderma cornu-damae]|uniref:Uncharacterized protein n=1 Tax=Trichoderma cornu-damae TaxID=654480 RepID=A0A9P8QPR2_9HYPO|nr:hypothetical protein Trco_000150 [Trichoderma cornu-damae]